jgi:long-chain acyl-CoA synthetase
MNKLWLKNYQQGVPHEIDPSTFSSLVDLFETSCGKHRDNIAYVNMGCELRFSALDTLSAHFAAFLQGLGLKKGARVALMMPNLLQYPVALFAILRAGFVVVNVNPLYTQDELVYQLNDSGAQVIIVMANFAKTVEQSRPHTPQLKHIVVTQLGDLFPSIKRILVNAVVKHIKKMVPSYTIPEAISFNQALEQGQVRSLSSVMLTHSDTAFIQYTGGTTGVAKGAVLTHGNLIANVLQASAWIAPLSINTNDIIVTALPLYHIFSLTANCLTFLNFGAKNILITNPRDITGFIKEIKRSHFTAITGVNTLFNALLNHPQFSSVDFSKLKLALSGGMALQKSVSIAWREKTHAPILEAYGLTETSPAVAINPMYLEEYNGSIGLPLPSTNISIRDLDGNELPLGEKGELCVKGPQVMAGYWQRDDETALVFWPDGFLRTGDIVMADENGFIYLLDRIKDMILISGFNVYPTEIEQVIGQMPQVLEVGVIGVNDENAVEKVKACIVKRDPTLTAEQVIAYTREHLTAYKVPKIVEFYEELPKTNVGKILKRQLR